MMTGFGQYPFRNHSTASEAFAAVLSDLRCASPSAPVAGGTEKVRGATLEALGYSFGLTSLRARLVSGGLKALDLPVAVARFVWMMSGSNRLADIAFYEPMVKHFTDDGVVVPGSSYGMRIFQSAPGLDQLKGVIERLKEDRSTRRGAVSVHVPMDAVRESNDIPCTFGLFFHVRDDRLHLQTIMRSNNAWGLLPFNIFEFTMLAEVVAAEVGAEPGGLLHFAASMHVYDRDVEKLGGLETAPPGNAGPMDVMPRFPSPLAQLNKLIVFEAQMRHDSAAIGSDTIGEWVIRARDLLDPYWLQFALLLLWAVGARRQDVRATEKVAALLKAEYRALLPPPRSAASRPSRAPDQLGSLFGPSAAPEKVVLFPRTQLVESIKRHAVDHERNAGVLLGAGKLFDLQERLSERLAARGLDGPLSREEFTTALHELEGSGGG